VAHGLFYFKPFSRQHATEYPPTFFHLDRLDEALTANAASSADGHCWLIRAAFVDIEEVGVLT
jgi:hypothetical protein